VILFVLLRRIVALGNYMCKEIGFSIYVRKYLSILLFVIRFTQKKCKKLQHFSLLSRQYNKKIYTSEIEQYRQRGKDISKATRCTIKETAVT